MQIIPAIDLLESKVVRLSQGDYNKVKIYSDSPLSIAQEFADHKFARLHIVDLSGAKNEKPFHTQLIHDIKQATNCQIEMGGGIRTYSQVKHIFDTCLDHETDYVMLGSLPFKDSDEFEKIVVDYANNILLTLDVWGESIRISGWREDAKKNIFEYISKFRKEFIINSFLVTQIKSDGLLDGPDIPLYQKLLAENPHINLIASGGISSVEDIKKLAQVTNVDGIVVGKAIYEKKISLDEISKDVFA